VSNPIDFVTSVPHQHAIYLPAVNTIYPKIIDSEIPLNRSIPANFELEDLAFWTGNSKLFNHKYLLHSIGGYDVGSVPKGPLFRKTKGDFWMLGDCGGFQIGKGTLKGLKRLSAGMAGSDAVAAWGANYDAKVWIINWLEQHADYAMTIDMPLWAMTTTGKNSPFHKCDESQLLAMTVENLHLINREKQGRTKWLNVIQGTNGHDTLRWWNAVKWFKGGGWSLAGAAGWRGGIANVLSTVLTMRDEGAFEPGMDWVHMLGVSQPMWDIFLTAIQIQLRNRNPNIQFSYDSASPFESGGARDQYAIAPALGLRVSDWTVSYKTFTALRSHADTSQSLPAPFKSPIGDLLSLKDLVINNEEMVGRRIDKFTNTFIVNHNVFIYLDAGERANHAAFHSSSKEIPVDFGSVLAVIEKAFASNTWEQVLADNRQLLDRVAPSSYK